MVEIYSLFNELKKFFLFIFKTRVVFNKLLKLKKCLKDTIIIKHTKRLNINNFFI
jgi:hypothetical protein